MTFKDTMHVVSSTIFQKLLIPNWMMGFTERTRRTRLAFEELEVRTSIRRFTHRALG